MKKVFNVVLKLVVIISLFTCFVACGPEPAPEPKEYKITYVLAGGQATNPAKYTDQTDTFTLVNPSKEGYDFAGWTYEGQTTPQMEVKIEKGSEGNKTFTATYVLHKYTVTYNGLEGAENGHNPVEFTMNDEDIKIRKPVKEGYEFLGWTYEGQTTPTSKVSIEHGTKKNLVFTAHFKEWEAFTNEVGKDYDNEYTKSGLFTATKKDILVFDYKLVTPAEDAEESVFAFMVFNEATDLNWEKYVGYVKFNPYTNEAVGNSCIAITEKGDGWYTVRFNMWNAPISGAVTKDYVLTDFYLRGAWTNCVVTLDNFSIETQEVVELPEGFSDLDVIKSGGWQEYNFKDFTIAKRDDLKFDIFFTKQDTVALRLFIAWGNSTSPIFFNVADSSQNSEGVTVSLKEGTTDVYTVIIDVEKANLIDGANAKTEFEMLRFPTENEADFYIGNVTKIAGEPLPEEADIVDVVVPAEFADALTVAAKAWGEYMFDGFTVAKSDFIAFDVFVPTPGTCKLRLYVDWGQSTSPICFNVADSEQNSSGVTVSLKEGTTNVYTVTIEVAKTNYIDGATDATQFNCIRFPDANETEFLFRNFRKVN